MQRNEIIIVLKKLKIAYPRFYADMSKEDAQNTIVLWEDMFKEDNGQLVMAAVDNLIVNFKYPPTIADVKEEMYKLTNKEVAPIELWVIAKKMIGKGIYMTQEEFEQYPDTIKAFFGGLSGLKDIAKMDSETVNSVIQSNFLKQIKIIQDREKADKQMLPSTKRVLEMLDNVTKAIEGGK